jgi:hypothetical protein
MKRLVSIGLIAVTMMAKSPKLKRELSQTEIELAYDEAVNHIYEELKAPSTAHFGPIEETQFQPKGKNGVYVVIWVDAQNSYGAMLRQTYHCSLTYKYTFCGSFGR